jgi:hypothetical protein
MDEFNFTSRKEVPATPIIRPPTPKDADEELSDFHFTTTIDIDVSQEDNPKYLPNNLGDILSAAAGADDADLLGYSQRSNINNTKFNKFMGKLSGSYRSTERLTLPTSKSGGAGDLYANFFGGNHDERPSIDAARSADFRLTRAGSVQSTTKKSYGDLPQSLPVPAGIQSAVYSLAGMPMNIQTPTDVSSMISNDRDRPPKLSKTGKSDSSGAYQARNASVESNIGRIRHSVVESARERRNLAARSAKDIGDLDDGKPKRLALQSQLLLNSPVRRNIVNVISQPDLIGLDDGAEGYRGKRSLWEKLKNPIEVC